MSSSDFVTLSRSGLRGCAVAVRDGERTVVVMATVIESERNCGIKIYMHFGFAPPSCIVVSNVSQSSQGKNRYDSLHNMDFRMIGYALLLVMASERGL